MWICMVTSNRYLSVVRQNDKWGILTCFLSTQPLSFGQRRQIFIHRVSTSTQTIKLWLGSMVNFRTVDKYWTFHIFYLNWEIEAWLKALSRKLLYYGLFWMTTLMLANLFWGISISFLICQCFFCDILK